VFGPRRIERDTTARARVAPRRKKSPPAPGRRGTIPHRRGAGDCAKPTSYATPGQRPAPRKSGLRPDMRLKHTAGEDFRARGFGVGGSRVLARSPPHQQNLRLGCAKIAILYPLPGGARRGDEGSAILPLPEGRGSNFSILAQAKC